MAALITVVSINPCFAQRHKWHDEGLAFRRVVEVPPTLETPPTVIVTEFFSHGARPNGTGEVLVFSNRDRVPSQVLQGGPGDVCRVAFAPQEREQRYFLYYGGKSTEPDNRPLWSPPVGLLFETREWGPCNLSDLAEVRQAFERSRRIGADVVGEVFHRHNPFAAEPGPFLSRYTGSLEILTPGRYTFYTSSQDCSFVLIDGRLIVSAPGVHEPDSRAKIKGEIELAKGPHRFEYYQAASGSECCMVAAWQMPGFDKPAQMSPDLFQYRRVLRLTPVSLEHREDGYLPDFRVAVVGDLPAEEDHPAMVRAQFMDATTKTVSNNARYQWQFGDGQGSELVNPGHIYLHPGSYRVALTLGRGTREDQVVNQVVITRQFMLDPKGLLQAENLQEYLTALEQFNASQLDEIGLVQLVRIYLLSDDPTRAAAAAQAAFGSDAKHSDETRWALVRLVGPAMRFQLDNPLGAAGLWRTASRMLVRPEWKATCAVEAADILLNDLLLPNEAADMLAVAESKLGQVSPAIRSRFERVTGDWFARTGKGREARQAYQRAQAKRELSLSVTEQNAWRGAHSRSAESFLFNQELDRARTELDDWQRDYPADMVDGYWSLLQVRYWMARAKPELAIVVANDALTVNPNSPYADRMLLLAAQCEEKRGDLARALATLRSLGSDYPGSPLVEFAQSEIKRLTTPRPADAEGKEGIKPAAAGRADKPPADKSGPPVLSEKKT